MTPFRRRWPSRRARTSARRFAIAAVIAVCAAAPFAAQSPAAGACEKLAALTLPDTPIMSATAVPAGSFRVPGGRGRGGGSPPTVRAFCRVAAMSRPQVRFEVWLPQDWNGKFQGVGNGGTAGVIPYPAMLGALNRGYAVAGTDTGHVNNPDIPFDATWSLGHPELVVDYAYRSTHVAAEHGKAIARAFYNRQPSRAYFVGCSKGGQQALIEAQRYPGDYDGIIAGDPGNNHVRFYAGGHLWYALATLKDPESYIPPDRLPILTDAVNAACDRLDGIADGVIDDPRQCKFDPAVLMCKAGQDPQRCFTPKQVTTIKAIWSGARNSKGELVYPGLVPGAEAAAGGWASWVTGPKPFTSTHWYAQDGFFKNAVFEDPNWDFRTFDYDKDLAFALRKAGPAYDAIDPDLRKLATRGGKLIVYHGWNDPDISPLNSIAYYDQVTAFLSKHKAVGIGQTRDFFRLFMVPGMLHCTGGPGPDRFDALAALEQWVENGVAPDRIVASHSTEGKVDRTRPLCPYPQVAKWTGSGSSDDAANFTCGRR
jgi:feruloyl esterase